MSATPGFLPESYRVPSGFLDVPFCYVYDATGLVDGTSPVNIGFQLQNDAPFILRHIAGVPLVVDTAANGGRWSYRNSDSSYAIGRGQGALPGGNNWPVMPEKIYDPGKILSLDFYNVKRNTNWAGVLNSFIGFFGVKRFPVSGFAWYDTPYQYREQYQIFNFSVTINWPNTAAPQLFQLPTLTHDFELMRIFASFPTGNNVSPLRSDFQLQLQLPDQSYMSNIPVNQEFLNSSWAVTIASQSYQGVFPVPTVVYPRGGTIAFRINSLIPQGNLPQGPWVISFEGNWRIPK